MGQTRYAAIHAERGAALVTSLAVFSILAIMVVITIDRVVHEEQHAGHWRHSTQAFYLAEAAVNQGVAMLRSGGAGRLPYAHPTTSYARGTYEFAMQQEQASNGTVRYRIAATGRYQDVERAVRVCVMPKYFDEAMLIGGSLWLTGTPSIYGDYGSVHVNGSLITNGQAYVQKDATATNGLINGDDIVAGGVKYGYADPKEVPKVVPSYYRAQADYILQSDGTVEDQQGKVLAREGRFNGWKCGSSGWAFSSSTSVDGTYYIEGNATLQGNPGTANAPWRLTLIATGTILVGGTPYLTSYTQGLTMVAGEDLKITGNVKQSFQGALLTHEQIQITGDPFISGVIIAEDAENLDSTVDHCELLGNPVLRYDEPLGIMTFGGNVTLVNWHHHL